jgi:hypothetical protein
MLWMVKVAGASAILGGVIVPHGCGPGDLLVGAFGGASFAAGAVVALALAFSAPRSGVRLR